MSNEKLSRLIAQAKEERSIAIQNAKRFSAVVRSRGVELACLDERGELIEREYDVKLTQKGIREEVARGVKLHGAVKFAITGGVDGADSVWELNNWEYEPMVECWDTDDFTASEIGVEQVMTEVKL